MASLQNWWGKLI